MPLLNPVYGLIVPFLCIFTIPLAIFAGITTTLAFSILMFRVGVVYLDIALALIPHYLTGGSGFRGIPGTYQYAYSSDGFRSPASAAGSFAGGSGHTTSSPTVPSSAGAGYAASGYQSPRYRSGSALGISVGVNNAFSNGGRRSRRSSLVSMASVGTIMPIPEVEDAPAMSRSGMTPSVGIDRDFEGVGGWRLDDRGDDDDWIKINSRLELPQDRTSNRHHQRSQSGGGTVTPGEGGYLVMKTAKRDKPTEEGELERGAAGSGGKPYISPNSSRIRINQTAPVAAALTSMDKEDGYFPRVST